MNHRVDGILLKDAGQVRLAGAIADNQGRLFSGKRFNAVKRLGAGVGKIVQSHDLVAGLQQAQRRVGTDITRAARQ